MPIIRVAPGGTIRRPVDGEAGSFYETARSRERARD
jgi:hypothetical protein